MSETLLETITKNSTPKLIIPLGADETGKVVELDLGTSGNCLINYPKWLTKDAGLVKTILASLLAKNTPADLRLIVSDPSEVGLDVFDGISYLLTPVIKDAGRFIAAHQWSLKETQKRIKMFEEVGAKSIEEYNQMSGFTAMEYILVVDLDLIKIMATTQYNILELMNYININARKTGLILLATTSQTKSLITKNYLTKIIYRGEYEVGYVDYLAVGRSRAEKIKLAEISDIEVGKVIGSSKWQELIPE